MLRRFASPSPLLSISPSLFFFSGFLVRQMRGEGQPTPYIGAGAGRPAAGRPWRPAARLPGDRSPGTCLQFFSSFFSDKPPPPGSRAARSRPPGSGAAGVYFCKFPNRKYIFVKNRNKKYKNIKKTAFLGAWTESMRATNQPIKFKSSGALGWARLVELGFKFGSLWASSTE